jgi:hypothetical protein
VIYNRLLGVPNNPGSTLQGCDGHGNENSQIIAGYVPTGTVNGVHFDMFPHADALSFRYGLGVAPFVKVGSSVIFDPNDFTSPVYSDLESRAYNDGARISSNSWGSSDNSYSVDAQQYDALVRDAQLTGSPFPAAGNQEYIIVFAAGNDGPAPFTIGEPSTAKNVITVGAAENVQRGYMRLCGPFEVARPPSEMPPNIQRRADVAAIPASPNRKIWRALTEPRPSRTDRAARCALRGRPLPSNA